MWVQSVIAEKQKEVDEVTAEKKKKAELRGYFKDGVEGWKENKAINEKRLREEKHRQEGKVKLKVQNIRRFRVHYSALVVRMLEGKRARSGLPCLTRKQLLSVKMNSIELSRMMGPPDLL